MENAPTDADSSPLAPDPSGFAGGADAIRAALKTMPSRPGVYRMLNESGKPLYVGKAKDLKKRVTSYTQRARLPDRLQRMVAQTHSMEIVVTATEAEALLLEANLIQQYAPPYNILFRDDKSYPYIALTREHEFPRIAKHRGPQKRGTSYFGPFASSAAVDETLIALQKAFRLRNCADTFFAARRRPCLQYHIRRCTAPCVGRVTRDAYADQVRDALAFLSGQSQEIQKKLAEDMHRASEAQDYETAAALRDRIRVLTQTQAVQDVFIQGLGDADVIAVHQAGSQTAIQIFFYRQGRNYGTRCLFPAHEAGEGAACVLEAFLAQFYADKPAPPVILVNILPDEADVLAEALSRAAGRKVALSVPSRGDRKRLMEGALENARTALARKQAESAAQKKLLDSVATLFGLAAPPQRIEVYDNSHISGRFAVGAMIAAGPEGFLKKTYRKFNIRDEEVAGDDYGMMAEVLTRRFTRLLDEDPARVSGLWPDVLLIDGGAGQTNRVVETLAKLGVEGVAIVGIAKGPDRNAGRERFFVPGQPPFSLPPDDPVMHYLQRLRDEAHRFAIGTHRARRAKAIGVSLLDDLPGIGTARKKALLTHFGSAKAVQDARPEDLVKVDGISPSLAQKIYDSFHKDG